MTEDKCPSCGEKIKSGMFGTNEYLDSLAVALINEYEPEKKEHRCNNCGNALVDIHRNSLVGERSELGLQMAKAVNAVPLATIHSPLGWDYKVVSLVTAQSTTGTGILSEFTSSFTDFFGTQSGSYNNKLKDGENLCRSLLQKQAFDAGANAILAVDIDYAEVGGGKGMLMVCMSGTAVRVVNIEVLGEAYVSGLAQMNAIAARIEHLGRYQKFIS